MQLGTTKDQGLYNKPSAAVHPGALAAGTLPQYNTVHYINHWSGIKYFRNDIDSVRVLAETRKITVNTANDKAVLCSQNMCCCWSIFEPNN